MEADMTDPIREAGRLEVSFFKVRDNRTFEEYQCGPALVDEAAIMYFNATDGRKIGKAFTTQQTGAVCGSYVLIEQGRKSAFGLHDIRSIDLYEKPMTY
jgi:hypothetical protein